MDNENNDLATKNSHASASGQAVGPWSTEEKTFHMLMHLSALTSWILPGAGIILPIVMWATNKDKYSDVHLHGLIIFNWIISFFIYAIICVILMVVMVGFLLIFVLGIVSLIFTIIAAIKANNGEFWPYPLSIDFFGVKQKLAERQSL